MRSTACAAAARGPSPPQAHRVREAGVYRDMDRSCIPLGVEAVFLFLVTRFLQTPYSNLTQPSWHALEFSLAFAVTGAAMTLVLHRCPHSAARAAPVAGD